MIPHSFNVDLASSNSPYREGREVWFALDEEENNESSESAGKASGTNPLAGIISNTRKQLFMQELAELSQDNAEAMQAFFSNYNDIITHLSEQGELNSGSPLQEQVETLRLLFHEAVESQEKSEREKTRPIVYFNADREGNESFTAAYIKHKGNKKPETIPNAFQTGKTIYFNANNIEFRNEETRNRAVAHELSHFVLRRESQENPRLLAEIKQYLESANLWRQLKTELDTAYGKTLATEDEYVHEICAIYFAGETHAFSIDGPHRNIHSLISSAIQEEKNRPFQRRLAMLRSEIDLDYAHIKARFDNAVEEQIETETDGAENLITEDELVFGNTDEENTERERARARVAEAAEEAKQAKPQDVLAMAQRSKTRIEAIREGLEAMSSIINKLPEKERREHAASIKAAQNFLETAGTEITVFEKKAENLSRWDTDLTAAQKIKFAHEWNFTNKNEYIDGADFQIADKNSKDDRQQITEEIASWLGALDKPLEDMEQYVDYRSNAEKESHGAPPTIQGAVKSVVTLGGNIEWIRIDALIKAFKTYKEAITESYNSQTRIQAYKVVKGTVDMLDYIPFGRPVKQILNKQVRAANHEEENKFAEFVKSEGFIYDQIFKRGGLLDQNRYNINHVKGILEYAADHAWLYHLDRQNSHDVYGIDYEKEFGVESFRDLVQKNEAGKKREDARGYERVDLHPEIYMIIEDMKEEMHEKNIFAVKGMLRRLHEKAKLAESNTWGAVTLLRGMREDEELLKIMDSGLLDAIGGIGIDKSAWTLTWFKILRKDFMAWKKIKGKENFTVGAKGKENIFTKTVQHIEELLPDSLKHNTKTLDHEVAKVLAGQTSRISGSAISIFMSDPVFDKYRKSFGETTESTSTSPSQTDDDFFNPKNGGSDILLLGTLQTKAIIKRESQGSFEHKTRAANFFAQVFMRYRDLKDVPQNAQENFRREMSAKIEDWMNSDIRSQTAIRQIMYDKDSNKKLIVEELKNTGIISITTYNRLITESQKSA